MKSYSLALRNRFKRMIAGMLAGVVLGTLVLGLGGRLLMRIVALIGGVNPGASLGGTLEVLAFGSLTGTIAGILSTIIQGIFPKNPWLKGATIGLLLYGFLLLIPFDSKLAAKGFPQLQSLIHVLFGSVCLVYGLLVTPAINSIEKRLRS